MSMISSDMKRFEYEVEKLRTEFVLNFNDSLTRAEEFVAEISELKSDVNAAYGVRNVDAKSVMGFMGISHLPVKVTIVPLNDIELKKFNEICRKYEVIKWKIIDKY